MIYIGESGLSIHFFPFPIFSRPSYLTRCRGSKLALLHRVKEGKTPSLSAQASFAPFSLKVAWSGKSLIGHEYLSTGHYTRTPTVRALFKWGGGGVEGLEGLLNPKLGIDCDTDGERK